MTGTPPPAAPAAPATPPTAPPSNGASARAPAAVAKPVSKPAQNLADAYSELDKMAGGSDSDADNQPVTTPRQLPTPPGKTARESADKVANPETPDQPETPETPEQNGEEKPVKARQLGKVYEDLKVKYAALEKKFAEIEAERAKPPPEDPEKKKLGETLAQRDARLKELEDTLKFKDYTASEEYDTSYRKPYMKAFAEGRQTVSELKLADAEGNVRQGTEKDFDAIMGISDPNAAAEAIEQLFGTGVKAQMVIAAREKVRDILGRARSAEEDYQKNGVAREAERAAAIKKQQGEIASVFDRESKGAVQKYPKLFGPIEGDEKGNELLAKGFERADAAFGGTIKDADGKPIKLSPLDMAALHAEIRNKAGNHDRAIYLLAQERKANKDLKKKLADYEDSEPSAGAGRGNRRGEQSTDDIITAGLMKYAR